MQFSISILFNFHWENGLVINIFHIVAPNSPKPSQCTLTHRELSKIPRVQFEVKNVMVWEILA
jgi:hypothetical protein